MPGLLRYARNDGAWKLVIARRNDEAIQVQATTWIASLRSLVTGHGVCYGLPGHICHLPTQNVI
ncbi:MAG: hypothetical protein LBJ47_11605, partial [Tannerella sp.]|nr:hypothetical protein [Tannerella sp.]